MSSYQLTEMYMLTRFGKLINLHVTQYIALANKFIKLHSTTIKALPLLNRRANAFLHIFGHL
jgi:hypothetical protein